MKNSLEVTTCSIHLHGFDGPLELLLNLVREQRFDITTVVLATVAEQYLAYVAAMETLDVDAAAEYLVIAATLAYLKSRSLLPPLPSELAETGEESPEAVEERLRARLIAYSRYRDAALSLQHRADEVTGFYLRSCGDPAAELTQRYHIESNRLSQTLQRALMQAKPERRNIVRERYSLVLQMEYVARKVGKGETSFLALVAGYDRAGIIVTFLAILELARQGRLTVTQDEDDDISLRSQEVAEVRVH